MYILLISVWFGGPVNGGYDVHTQEFSSRDTCKIAKHILIRQLDDGPRYSLDCVEK